MSSIDEYMKNTQIDEQIHKFKLKKRVTLIVKITAVIIIVFSLILFVYEMIIFVKKASVFSINNVIVKGNMILTAKDIFEIGELDRNKNIFRIDLKQLRDRLELHPLIKQAVVSRRLPDKLIITIQERHGIALINVQQSDFISHLYEVDNDGYIIAEDNNIVNIDKPVITGMNNITVIPGEKITNSRVLKVLSLLEKVSKEIYLFNRLISEINVSRRYTDIEYTLIMDKWNFPVYMGKEINLVKFFKLNALLMALGNKLYDIEYIDFKYNDAVGKFKS